MRQEKRFSGLYAVAAIGIATALWVSRVSHPPKPPELKSVSTRGKVGSYALSSLKKAYENGCVLGSMGSDKGKPFPYKVRYCRVKAEEYAAALGR